MARWFRHDVGLLRHPKVLALGTPARKLLWLEVVGYCAEYETGGWVPSEIAEAVSGVTPAFLRRCIELDLLDVHEDGETWVHGYAEYQPVDNGKAARQARWRSRKKGVPVDGGEPSPVDGEQASPVDVAETSTETAPSRGRPRVRGTERVRKAKPPEPEAEASRARTRAAVEGRGSGSGSGMETIGSVLGLDAPIE